MSKPNWTPGPWVAEGALISDGKNLLARTYDNETLPDNGASLEMCLANARIIAASPDMAEALKKLPLEAFDKPMGQIDAAQFVDYASAFMDAMEAARAALAKAEGK